MEKYNVAVLGASNSPDRYSYKAVKALSEHGHSVFPVHPSGMAVGGIKCYQALADIQEPLDTVSVYLSEKNSSPLIEEIVKVSPRRVILSPGAESDKLKNQCEAAGIQVLEACTLVMLSTGQF